jgi:hypothetical protein
MSLGSVEEPAGTTWSMQYCEGTVLNAFTPELQAGLVVCLDDVKDVGRGEDRVIEGRGAGKQSHFTCQALDVGVAEAGFEPEQ